MKSITSCRGLAGMLEFVCDVEKLSNGNVLVADAGDETGQGSEILEVNHLGQIIWRYGYSLKFAHGAKRLENGNTLISDTGNDRIIEVSPERKIVFTSDEWGDGSGVLSDGSHLRYPNDCHKLKNNTYLITDRNNDRCIIADCEGKILWSYEKDIRHPHNCDPMPNGNIIIASSDSNEILEVNRKKEIVWHYGRGENETLQWPRDADRLDNGSTLITDSKNSRIIEVNLEGNIIWEYKASYFANFYEADKLDNGNVLIADQQHKQVIEVDQFGSIVWLFRNYRNVTAIYDSLKNGSFRRICGNLPENWILNTRLAEGGGEIIWDETEDSSPCPCLCYDRSGMLYLQQNVAIKSGRVYRMGGKIKTKGIKDNGFAFLQMAFVDEYGGLIEDVLKAPRGKIFTGTNDWTEDTFEAAAPENAMAVELRVAITGQGKVWVKDIMFFG